MSKHLYVKQTTLDNTIENNVQSTVVKKLYDIVVDNERLGDFIDNSSDFRGEINTGYTYKKYKDKIENTFSGLKINPLNLYVYFEDKKVEQLLINKYAPGESGILENQSFQNGYGFDNLFRSNTEITTFDELNQLSNLKKISNSAFRGCTNLRSIDLSNIIQIDWGAFIDCTSLEIDVNIPNLSLASDSIFEHTGIISISSLGTINTLPIQGFKNCGSLVSADLSSIQIINRDAFNGCTNLSTLTNTLNILNIGNNAFYGCSSLSNFSFNENITIIGAAAFNGCTSLTIDDLYLPNLTSLGESAFRNTKVKKVSNLGNIQVINSYEFGGCTSLTSVTLPTSVTSLGERAFDGCILLSELNNISIITNLGSYVFSGCDSLTLNVSQMTSLTSIGERAFVGVNITGTLDLTNITNIHQKALIGSKIKSLTVPLSLQDKNIIDGMTELKTVNINIAAWTTIPSFKSCPNIEPFIIYMPLLTKISDSGRWGVSWSIGEVYGPSKWTQVYWPNATEIFNKNYYMTGEYTRCGIFSEGRPKWTNFDLIYIKNIERIDYTAFNFTTIKAFVVDNINVPTIIRHENGSEEILENMNSFAHFNVKYVRGQGWIPDEQYIIYVPDSSINDYKTEWSAYTNVIKGISELNGGVKYATEADWVAAGKPIALIEEYMN